MPNRHRERLTVLSIGYPLAPVTPDPAGGAEQVLAQLDRSLVAAEHRSIVIAPAGSTVVGELVPAGSINPGKGLIELKVNGQVRQTSDLSKMIWAVPEVIANLSRLVHLAPGDLIMTGTPENVAAVGKGDLLEGVIEGVGTVSVRIA